MKTEISVPAQILEEAQRLADTLGMSMSDLFVAALAAYVAAQQAGDITGRLNELYAKEDSALEPGLVTLQIASTEREEPQVRDERNRRCEHAGTVNY